MNKLLAMFAALMLVLVSAGAALGADGGTGDMGRVLIAVNGDVEVAAGEEADAVIVVGGTAEIAGTVTNVIVADGTVSTASGATLDSLTVISGTALLASGTTIHGDISQLNSTIDQAEGVQLDGSVRDMAVDAAAFGLFLGLAWIVLWIGAVLATLLLGLLVAGLAARQVRLATGTISREPAKTFLIGLLSMIVPPFLAVVAFLTVIGIPAGLLLLLVLWPIAAFAGYMVAAIWIGEWLLGRRSPSATPASRPYLAVVVGLVVAFLLGFIPLVSGIISIFGLGAVVLTAWRTLRGGSTSTEVSRAQPIPAG